MNNLYGWGLSSYIPYGEFKWLKNVDVFDVNSVSEKKSNRIFSRIDLEYPDELHELYNDYPLAPEKLLFLVICCQNTGEKLLVSMR